MFDSEPETFKDLKVNVTIFNQPVFVKRLRIDHGVNSIPSVSLQIAPLSTSKEKEESSGLFSSDSDPNNKNVFVDTELLNDEAKALQNKVLERTINFENVYEIVTASNYKDIDEVINGLSAEEETQSTIKRYKEGDIQIIAELDGENNESVLGLSVVSDQFSSIQNIFGSSEPETANGKIMRFSVNKPSIVLDGRTIAINITGQHISNILNTLNFSRISPAQSIINLKANDFKPWKEELSEKLSNNPRLSFNELLNFTLYTLNKFKDEEKAQIQSELDSFKVNKSITKNQVLRIELIIKFFNTFFDYNVNEPDSEIDEEDDNSDFHGLNELLSQASGAGVIFKDDATRAAEQVVSYMLNMFSQNENFLDVLFDRILPRLLMIFYVDLLNNKCVIEQSSYYAFAQRVEGNKKLVSDDDDAKVKPITKSFKIKKLDYSLAPNDNLPISQVLVKQPYGASAALGFNDGEKGENAIIGAFPTKLNRFGRIQVEEPPIYATFGFANGSISSSEIDPTVQNKYAAALKRIENKTLPASKNIREIILNKKAKLKSIDTTQKVKAYTKFFEKYAKGAYYVVRHRNNTATIEIPLDLTMQPGKIYNILGEEENYFFQGFLHKVNHRVNVQQTKGAAKTICEFRYVRSLYVDEEASDLTFIEELIEFLDLQSILAGFQNFINSIFGAITSIIQSFFNAILEFVGDVIEKIEEQIDSFIEDIKNALPSTDFVGDLVSTFENIGELVENLTEIAAFVGVLDNLTEASNSFSENANVGLENAKESVPNSVNDSKTVFSSNVQESIDFDLISTEIKSKLDTKDFLSAFKQDFNGETITKTFTQSNNVAAASRNIGNFAKKLLSEKFQSILKPQIIEIIETELTRQLNNANDATQRETIEQNKEEIINTIANNIQKTIQSSINNNLNKTIVEVEKDLNNVTKTRKQNEEIC